MVAAPASRRYFAGWFTEADIHVLSSPALERRASKVPGSREALLLSPLHEYSHLVIGANNPDLPPPFSPAAFRRYVRWAWLCEGGAVWLSGQTPHLRAAIMRRLREGGRPEFPPSPRDAMLLGGTIFSMLEREGGPAAAVALATSPLTSAGRARCSWTPSSARWPRSSATGAPSSTRCQPPPEPGVALGQRRRAHDRAARPRVLPVEERLVGAPDQHRRRVVRRAHSATPAVAAVAPPAKPSWPSAAANLVQAARSRPRRPPPRRRRGR